MADDFSVRNTEYIELFRKYKKLGELVDDKIDNYFTELNGKIDKKFIEGEFAEKLKAFRDECSSINKNEFSKQMMGSLNKLLYEFLYEVDRVDEDIY